MASGISPRLSIPHLLILLPCSNNLFPTNTIFVLNRPDLCDGTYDQFCTNAPQYTNITNILQAAGQDDLLSYMNTYWLPDTGTSENFWEHEWNKHGTCINTLAPSCYGDAYTPGMEVVDFFTRTVELFKTLDTYTALANAGITPSTEVTYTNQQIQDALTQVTGSAVVLGCTEGALNQAWYSYNVRGSLQTGTFVPTDPAGSGGKGTCPHTGISYLPKGGDAGPAKEGVDATE
jgi:ribonuclease T2